MADGDVDTIKQRLNIVDLVGQYVTLKKAGINHKGLCPFHQERSPSFMVNQERQIYKCFGCNEGGDAFDFVMKLEGLTFPEALQLLADRTGVILTKQAGGTRAEGQRDEKSRLYRVNQFAARYFAEVLGKAPSAAAAREYLVKRTVSNTSITEFQIGFAPDPNRIAELLRAKGVTATELSRAGNPERFRGRIMFPLTDPMGTVVGFTGRTLSDEVQPKYLNTPETPLFKKAKTLYGLTQAKQAIRQAGHAILVEGQMDVVLSHQAGVKQAIASSGTALTDDHLRMIHRYVPTVRFAFDADEAGFKATERAIFAALDVGLTVEVIPLPKGVKDVGELVERNPADWQQVATTAQPVIDWLMDELTKRHGHPTEAAAKKAFAKAVLPYLKRLTDPIEQAHYRTELARRVKVSESVITDALVRTKGQEQGSRSQEPGPKLPAHSSQPLTLVERLVVVLIGRPAELKRVMGVLDYRDLSSETDQSLFKTLQSCYTQLSQRPSFDSKAVLSCMEAALGADQRDRFLSTIMRAEANRVETTAEEASREIDELLARLKGSKHEQVKQTFAERIAAAEVSGDRQQVKQLMVELQSLLVSHQPSEPNEE